MSFDLHPVWSISQLTFIFSFFFNSGDRRVGTRVRGLSPATNGVRRASGLSRASGA